MEVDLLAWLETAACIQPINLHTSIVPENKLCKCGSIICLKHALRFITVSFICAKEGLPGQALVVEESMGEYPEGEDLTFGNREEVGLASVHQVMVDLTVGYLVVEGQAREGRVRVVKLVEGGDLALVRNLVVVDLRVSLDLEAANSVTLARPEIRGNELAACPEAGDSVAAAEVVAENLQWRWRHLVAAASLEVVASPKVVHLVAVANLDSGDLVAAADREAADKVAARSLEVVHLLAVTNLEVVASPKVVHLVGAADREATDFLAAANLEVVASPEVVHSVAAANPEAGDSVAAESLEAVDLVAAASPEAENLVWVNVVEGS